MCTHDVFFPFCHSDTFNYHLYISTAARKLSSVPVFAERCANGLHTEFTQAMPPCPELLMQACRPKPSLQR